MSDDLQDVLADVGRGEPSPIYLLVGEEFLVRRGADELIKKLLPDAAAGINSFNMDGASPREVANELATLPMFPGRKVVFVRDPEFLAPKKSRGDGLAKAREAWKAGKRKEGARRVLAVAARAGWSAADIDPSSPGAPSAESWKDELNIDLADADVQFLKEVAAFCKDEKITAPESDLTPLTTLFDKGVPKGHVLVMAASDVDSKNPFVKLSEKKGVVIERAVADRLKDLDLSELAAETLKPFKKKLSRSAEELLKDRLGGNMRFVQSELEKLALYVEGPSIEAADVDLLVGRVREGEFSELPDALQKRDLNAALRCVHVAIDQGAHGLLLLGSIASAVRNLLQARENLSALVKGSFRMTFNEFKSDLFPTIEREGKAAKAKVPHPYVAYLTMQAASRYSRDELLNALIACADADVQLKSSGDSKLVIERLLFKMLSKNAA
ncbi:MAG: DNA polymerase III subunit delta [Myxococcaceae bacterium]